MHYSNVVSATDGILGRIKAFHRVPGIMDVFKAMFKGWWRGFIHLGCVSPVAGEGQHNEHREHEKQEGVPKVGGDPVGQRARPGDELHLCRPRRGKCRQGGHEGSQRRFKRATVRWPTSTLTNPLQYSILDPYSSAPHPFAFTGPLPHEEGHERRRGVAKGDGHE